MREHARPRERQSSRVAAFLQYVSALLTAPVVQVTPIGHKRVQCDFPGCVINREAGSPFCSFHRRNLGECVRATETQGHAVGPSYAFDADGLARRLA